MKIATFNVNNVNRSGWANLLAWLEEAAPDVVCLQELKAADAGLSGGGAGGGGLRGGLARAAGVERGRDPGARGGAGGDAASAAGRSRRTRRRAISRRRSAGVLVGCLYAPNGNPQPGPKFDYKLAWLERFDSACGGAAGGRGAGGAGGRLQRRAGAAGHLSTRPTTTTRWCSRGRAAYRAAAEAGLDRRDPGDASRRDGLHLLGLPAEALGAERRAAARPPPAEPGALAGRLRRAGVDREVRGRENASDHAPVWIELGAARRRR